MKEEIKTGKTYLYITTKEGKTFKLEAKAPIEWPGTRDQKNDAKVETKTYTATLKFKMGKRMRERMKWALNGCKTRKEYRKFKKIKKRVLKDIKIINKIKDFSNPKEVRSLERLSKVLKNTKILTINV